MMKRPVGAQWLALASVLLLVLALGPSTALAQSKVGTAGMNFLQIVPTARVAGMGGAFVAVADDASSLCYNPAGLAWMNRREGVFGYTDYPADIMLQYAGVVVPVSPVVGVVGFAATALTMDDMYITTPVDSDVTGTGRRFTCGDVAVQLSYARMLTDRFSAGLSLRYIQEDLEDEKASGVGADIGTFYDTHWNTVKVGMNISNFGPDMKFIEESFPQPLNFTVGLSVEPLSDEMQRLILGFEGSHPNDNEERAAVGGEYTIYQMLSLRGGYKINYDAETWSAGVGVQVPLGMMKVKVDYSYTDFGKLTDIHRATLGISL
jgi:long-subunit fatty acid transport protein